MLRSSYRAQGSSHLDLRPPVACSDVDFVHRRSHDLQSAAAIIVARSAPVTLIRHGGFNPFAGMLKMNDEGTSTWAIRVCDGVGTRLVDSDHDFGRHLAVDSLAPEPVLDRATNPSE
jgi:hypothetical protein